MAKETVYNPEILRQLVDYDPETGRMTWKERPQSMFPGNAPRNAAAWNSNYAGKEAFITKTRGGYCSSTIFSKRMMAQRVAWCIHHQKPIPPGCYIDHINGIRDDNRAINLRLATPSENQANIAKTQNGLRGAFYHKSTGRWQASLRVHLGTFDTAEEASKAYEAAAQRLRGEFYLKDGKRVSVSRA